MGIEGWRDGGGGGGGWRDGGVGGGGFWGIMWFEGERKGGQSPLTEYKD